MLISMRTSVRGKNQPFSRTTKQQDNNFQLCGGNKTNRIWWGCWQTKSLWAKKTKQKTKATHKAAQMITKKKRSKTHKLLRRVRTNQHPLSQNDWERLPMRHKPQGRLCQGDPFEPKTKRQRFKWDGRRHKPKALIRGGQRRKPKTNGGCLFLCSLKKGLISSENLDVS